MLLIIFAWAIFFCITLGVGLGLGKLVAKYFSDLKNPPAWDIFSSFWWGLIGVVGFLQIYSLFFPVNGRALLVVLALSLVSALFSRVAIVRAFSRITKFDYFNRKNIIVSLFIFAFLIFLLYSASKTSIWYDTFLYHLNAVRWISDYPAVPGLANIHTRLGFNSSFFLFAALTDFWIFTSSSSHIALSLLVAVIIVQWIYSIFFSKSSQAVKVFSALALPFILARSWNPEAASLSTDLSMFILFLVFCQYLLEKKREYILLLVGLSGLILSFKLSGILAIVILFVYLVKRLVVINNAKFRIKILIASTMLLLFTVGGFVARNVVISGWILFPAPAGNLNLPWSVPETKAKFISERIMGWGRSPGIGSYQSVNKKFLEWFTPWLINMRLQDEYKLFFLGFFFLVAGIYLRGARRNWKELSFEWALVSLLSFLSIVLWVAKAPLAILGLHFFWAFFAAISLPFALHFSRWLKNPLLLFSISLFITLAYAGYGPIPDEPPVFRHLKIEPSSEVKAIRGSPDGEEPELILWIPVKGDQCGNSQLPCSNVKVVVRQRVPGDISKGFLSAD